ncbi:DUF4194 domain-containing protein [Cellvibrio sp. pealriver]|uniref:DUF4194 domain-containing protein n=1 Tax=Cellvibrio sp. pealriver TaxID=1622269 RepID=UPI00066FF8DC|nr:DUF4194 domain-containing protein [Cellvibrio sp. pealriver]
MSNPLSVLLQEQLDKHNLSLDNWRELVQRLLDYGVLCRDDSQVEAELYDRFLRIHELINDYFNLMGIRFQHDSHFRFVRILPPGARLPGMDDEADESFNTGLRSRLNQHEVALVLVLRAEYDKALREGSIDEQGCATLSLEAIALAMKSLLRRSLPENIGERRQAFKRLRQLRLINFFAEADIDSGESWIKIRPLIISLVSNEWLEQIRNHLAGNLLLVDEETDEQQDNSSPSSKKSSPHLNRSLFAAEE